MDGWMVKFVKTSPPHPQSPPSPHPPMHIPSSVQLSTCQRLSCKWFNRPKNIFEQTKIKFNCFEKMYNLFSESLLPQIFKFTKPSFMLVVLIKIVTSFYFKVCS